MEPITEDDKEECTQKISDLHPLQTEPFRKVFPLLGCLCCCLSGKIKELDDEKKKTLIADIDEQDEMLDEIIKKCGAKKYEGEDYAKVKKIENGLE